MILSGGPPHQDMVDAPCQFVAIPIATNVPGIEICEHTLLAGVTDKLASIISRKGT